MSRPADMSDNDDHGPIKKRKIVRACDQCRTRKVRCDAVSKGNGLCTNCINAGVQCKFVAEAPRRSPPKGYVEALKDIIHTLSPGLDIETEVSKRIQAQVLSGTRRASSSYPAPPTTRIRRGESKFVEGIFPKVVPSTDVDVKVEYESSDDEFGARELPKETELDDRMQQLSLSGPRRFHGKSSGVMLVLAACSLKLGIQPRAVDVIDKRPYYWRPSKWEAELWEDLSPSSSVEFPPPDLAHSLFALFFRYIAPLLPALHRASFESQYANAVHLRRSSFATVVLLVCAIASKCTDDPRVFLEGQGKLSAGWKWFAQVKDLQRSLHAPATISDLQAYALMAYYLSTTSAPHSAWTVTGLGIRRAQDIGAHRRKLYRGGISREEEQWKRVWWCLIYLDRLTSAFLGRSLACNDEDFDVDMPVEVDDEYWDVHVPLGSPSAMRQPSDVPSRISSFNCTLRLFQILSFALRTLYTINKSKVLLGFGGPEWDSKIITELNGALVRWLQSVPDHLRWDPERSNQTHFEQSAFLYANFYYIYNLIYRPFTTSPLRTYGSTTLPSFSLCVDAARACVDVLDILQRRSEYLPLGPIVSSCHAGVVILMGKWSAKKEEMNVDAEADRANVQKCLEFLRRAELTWTSAGRLHDVLRKLVALDALPTPNRTSLTRDASHEGHQPALASAPPNSPGPLLENLTLIDPHGRPVVISRSGQLKRAESSQVPSKPNNHTFLNTPSSSSVTSTSNLNTPIPPPGPGPYQNPPIEPVPLVSSFWDWPSTGTPNVSSAQNYESLLNSMFPPFDPASAGSYNGVATPWHYASDELGWDMLGDSMDNWSGFQFDPRSN